MASMSGILNSTPLVIYFRDRRAPRSIPLRVNGQAAGAPSSHNFWGFCDSHFHSWWVTSILTNDITLNDLHGSL